MAFGKRGYDCTYLYHHNTNFKLHIYILTTNNLSLFFPSSTSLFTIYYYLKKKGDWKLAVWSSGRQTRLTGQPHTAVESILYRQREKPTLNLADVWNAHFIVRAVHVYCMGLPISWLLPILRRSEAGAILQWYWVCVCLRQRGRREKTIYHRPSYTREQGKAPAGL